MKTNAQSNEQKGGPSPSGKVLPIDGKTKGKPEKKAGPPPNEKMLRCQNQETWMLYDLAVSMDQAVKRIRGQIGLTIDFQTGQRLLDGINTQMCVLEKHIKQACETVNMDWYKTPKGITKIAQMLGIEGNETPVDPSAGAVAKVAESDPDSAKAATEKKVKPKT